MSKYSGNKAGAKYGTGYCDAQCPRDLKFVNGEVSGHTRRSKRHKEGRPLTVSQGNSVKWIPSSSDQNAGVGGYGSCCTEMDIWCAPDGCPVTSPS